MKIPRDLNGRDIVRGLTLKYGYHKVHQEGSHIVLETDEPSHQRIVIPDHKYIRIGTLNSILRSVANHKNISREEILKQL